MAEIQKKHVAAIAERNAEMGIDDNNSQFENASQQEDPQEVKKAIRIMHAERRRNDWISFQQEELDESPVHAKHFRKGVDRGVHVSCYDYRVDTETQQTPISGPFLTQNKTTGKEDDRRQASADGGTSAGKFMRGNILNIQRQKELSRMKTPLIMRYNTDNEMSRAQSNINQTKMSLEALNGAKIANPNFRSYDKKSWIDRKKPFIVVKADTKLLSDRQDSSTHAARSSALKSQNPYIDNTKGGIQCKPIEDRLVLDKKVDFD